MTSPRCRLNGARESRPAGPINLQENPSTTSAIRQTRSLRGRRNLQCVRGLGVFHGRLQDTAVLGEIVSTLPEDYDKLYLRSSSIGRIGGQHMPIVLLPIRKGS